jgi:hypothetical protein
MRYGYHYDFCRDVFMDAAGSVIPRCTAERDRDSERPWRHTHCRLVGGHEGDHVYGWAKPYDSAEKQEE